MTEISRRTAAVERLRRELAEVRRQTAAVRGEHPPARIAVAVFVGAILGGVLPCLPHRLPALVVSSDEIARLRSPSGDLDALVVEINGGATTGFGYNVLLVPAGRTAFWGAHAASLDEAVRPDCAGGVDLKWISADRLEVSYLNAKRVDSPERPILMSGHSVTVRMEQGVKGSSPCR